MCSFEPSEMQVLPSFTETTRVCNVVVNSDTNIVFLERETKAEMQNGDRFNVSDKGYLHIVAMHHASHHEKLTMIREVACADASLALSTDEYEEDEDVLTFVCLLCD